MKPNFDLDKAFDEIDLRDSDDFDLKITIDLVVTSNKGFGSAQIRTALSCLESEYSEG